MHRVIIDFSFLIIRVGQDKLLASNRNLANGNVIIFTTPKFILLRKGYCPNYSNLEVTTVEIDSE